MRDSSWVGKVVDASLFVLSHQDRGGQEVVQDSVAVGNVNHTVVLGNFGDEVARVEIIRNGHS